ncbi:MAG TPA: L,D-transpeptidase family protein [Steroidobacteraceae bacterium]|nr:L,D-transpeptidase family protein [Steroidobacteraceae bacterium]
MSRKPILLAAALAVSLAACSLLDPPVEATAEPEAIEPAPPPAPVLLPSVATHRFEIGPDDDVVGHVQVVTIGEHDTLPDVARRFNVGYQEIVRANPGVDPWLPGVGREVVVPTQFVLPAAERKGIVINLAAMRIYYFPPAKKDEPQVVYTHPIGIGKVGWSTPEGKTKVVSKEKDPVWRPTASIREEHRKNGDPLPAVVPAGPDNPLGRHKFTLGWATYLIHGTNKPYGVGLRSSHGCIRMYPEDVAVFYDMIAPGTQVQVVNQPYVFGWHEGQLYLQAFDVLEDDKRDWGKSRPKILSKTLNKRIEKLLADRQESIDWDRVAHIASDPRGLTLSVSNASQTDEALIAAAPRVYNRVPEGANWDGLDDPALKAQRDVEAAVVEQRQAPRT